MRLLSLLIAFSCTTLLASEHYLMLPTFVPNLTRDVGPNQLIYLEEDVSIVKVELSKMQQWMERVHEELGGCGGFIDVTEEIEKGESPIDMVWDMIQSRHLRHDTMFKKVVRRQDVADLVSLANVDKYYAFLLELTAYENRSARSDKGVKAANFIQGRAMQHVQHLMGFKTFTVKTGGGYKQDSVVISLPGTDPSLPHVVMGAHMDTISPSSKQPGSDDDGSGSSVLMEALRVVGDVGAQFAHPVDFVWYAAEEHGLVGSKKVVDKFKQDGISVKAAIQFDMVGYNSPRDSKDIYMIGDYTDKGLSKTVRDLITTYTNASVGDTKCGYPCSDHVNWYRAGIPAAFPFEASFSNMNRKIHTTDDSLTYLDKDHAFRFVQLALAYLGEVADLQTTRSAVVAKVGLVN